MTAGRHSNSSSVAPAAEPAVDHGRGRDRAVILGAAATAGTRLVSILASFVTLAFAARVLSAQEFGLVATLATWWLIITMFDLGVGGALTTNVASASARRDHNGVRAHVEDALTVMAAIAGAIIALAGLALVVLPWRDWVGQGISANQVLLSVVITVACSALALPAAVGSQALQALQRFSQAQLCVALGSILTVVSAALVATFTPSPSAMLLAILGSPVLVSGVFTAIVLRTVAKASPVGVGFSAARIGQMMRRSVVLAIYTAANTLTLGSGTIIVGAVRGLTDAAVFGVAMRLTNPIITIIGSSGALLWPGMTDAIERGDIAWVRSRNRRGLMVTTGAAAGAGALLVVLGPWIARIWVGRELEPSYAVFFWTAVMAAAIAATSQASVLLMAVARLRAITWLALLAMVIGVGISVVLTRHLGINGAAIGPSVAMLFVLLPGVSWLSRDTLHQLAVQGHVQPGGRHRGGPATR